MSTGSSERQGSPQTGEKDYLKPKLMIQPQRVMEEEEIEECKTPTWQSGNQITTMLECPPAPRKKKPTSPNMRKSSAIDDHGQLNFFEEIKPEEVSLSEAFLFKIQFDTKDELF
ncbi:hypothetical protein JHK82_034255 [Glycine max]|uniref:Uncharacterized protein n=1 Tax=Glycine soja TaxID=3848 RepID=A0A445HRX0_GLYSO|nr:hypothetical protein JHK87_034190 [Glycine soja]KAG4981009.1 hypothetical protein JHK85_034967 [Glycine max]KAG4986634.1 hypothetical protein JHK86_034325 [Glycine max]KAG5119835.1 hypothetical protein JHK82_034255 [Glycine max]KAG5140824.1 hypothetical protein JHK84_034592 [Glycine max]